MRVKKVADLLAKSEFGNLAAERPERLLKASERFANEKTLKEAVEWAARPKLGDTCLLSEKAPSLTEKILNCGAARSEILAAVRIAVETSRLYEESDDIDEEWARSKIREVAGSDPSKGFQAILQVDEALDSPGFEFAERMASKFPKYEVAAVSHFSERWAQKKKSDRGMSLESAVDAALDVFNIDHSGQEFRGPSRQIEMDFSVGDCGISCKRSLRERPKQSFSREQDFGFGDTVFVTVNPDLSKEKLNRFANQGCYIYLPVDSCVLYEKFQQHEAVRPGTEFISDMKGYEQT